MDKFSRNIGLISIEQQEMLNKATVLVAGCGGMGGIAAESIVRMGIGNLILVDHDHFEESNINRQIHSNINTIGRKKADVLKEAFLAINPELNVTVDCHGLTKSNVERLVTSCDVVINGMDQMSASLILERTCRKMKKTIVDAWITPFVSVFVMTPDSPHWEEYLNLPTKGVPLEQLTDELCSQAMRAEVQYTFSHFNPFDYISEEIVNDVLAEKRPRPSLVPVVWLSGIFMANETMKYLTGQQCTDFAGVFYNQYTHEIIRGKVYQSVTLKKVA